MAPTPTAYMSPAQFLRRLTLSTSADPRLVELRARLLPADSKKSDQVEKSVKPEHEGPKRRKQVTVHGKHGTYQSTRLVGSDKPAPPVGLPPLVFDSAHPATGTLHGVQFAPWAGAPQTDEAWADVPGQDPYLEEPPIPPLGQKKLGSGVIIREPDGRVWLVKPTNSFGGYQYTFPKGGAEEGLSLQANAIKETFEEAGLQVKITGYAGDVERDTSVARYYFAERVGGTPSDHGWESEAVVLIDPAQAHQFLNKPADQHLAHQHAGAPTPPPPPPKPAYQAPPKMKPGGAGKKPSAPAPGQGSLFGGPSKPSPAQVPSKKPAAPQGPAAPDLFSAAAGKPAIPQLPSKKTLKLLAPTEPTSAALASKNGPALKAMQMVQQLVASGDMSPSHALPMVQAVQANDPEGSTALLVDFYKKRLVAYFTQLAPPQA